MQKDLKNAYAWAAISVMNGKRKALYLRKILSDMMPESDIQEAKILASSLY